MRKKKGLATNLKKWFVVFVLAFIFALTAKIGGELIGVDGILLEMPKDLDEIFLHIDKIIVGSIFMALLIVYFYYEDTK